MIRVITDGDWDQIIQLQESAYTDLEAEPVNVLRSKWVASPELCFVCEKDEKIAAYLLAHSWNSQEPPHLFEELPKQSDGSVLFVHDVVVAKPYSGMGLASDLIQHLFSKVTPDQFESALLVAVQNSQSFWKQFGFNPLLDRKADNSYGENAVLMNRSVL